MIHLWSFVAALAAVLAEAWFRTHPHLPYLNLWPSILLGVVVNYGVYRIMIAAPSFLAGFIIFSTMTLGLRLLAAVAIGEPPTWRLLAALVLLAASRWVALP